MSDFNKKLLKAEALRAKMQGIINSLDEDLSDVLEDDDLKVFYQTDGWCFAFGLDAENTPVSFIDVDRLLRMNCEDAFVYLEKHSI